MNQLPACCAPLQHHWPLPCPVAGAVFSSCAFDPARLVADDFQRAGIEQTASLQRSVAKRQAEYLAGRLCARDALQRVDGRVYVPGTDDERAPVWPKGISGSITHGNGWAAAVVVRSSDCQGIGIDQETLLSEERAQRLAGEILTPAELQRMDPAQVGLTVTLTFSLKESLFKALFPIVRKRFYFEHAEVVEWTADGQARLRLLTELSAEWHEGQELLGQFSLAGDQLLSLVTT